MSTCERFHLDGTYKLCGKPAAWSFNYDYPDRPCDCRKRDCPVNQYARKGSTLLCEDCYQHDRKTLRIPVPDNMVPADQQYTRVTGTPVDAYTTTMDKKKVTIVFRETRVYEVDVEVDPKHIHRNPEGSIYQLDCTDKYIAQERYYARELTEEIQVKAHHTDVVMVNDCLG